jgi:hypothetical protein
MGVGPLKVPFRPLWGTLGRMTDPVSLHIPHHLQPGTCVRHYKGGLYRIEGACLIESTLETGILYRPQQGTATDVLWMRPASAFDEMVETDNGPVRRFERI